MSEDLGTALVRHLRTITETTAPPFEESRRAALVAGAWRRAGLEARIDEVGNVVAAVPGGRGPRLVVAAHLDTVFGPEVPVQVRQDGEVLRAPGIGDNSASLAVLSVLAERLSEVPDEERPHLTLAATVGEEGLGDLRGARHLVAQSHGRADLFLALDGHLGTVVAHAVGSKRYEARMKGAGGHSWGDYPAASAVHAVGEAIHALTRLRVPEEPRSTLNVGQVWGGTSINAIAEEAGFNLDLRSGDAGVLEQLAQEARRAVLRAARRHGCAVELNPVGDRPVAAVDNAVLVTAARRALASTGVPVRVVASSTDANAAMAAGLPAIAFGVYRGGDAHRASEWLEPGSLVPGYRALLALLAELARE